MYWGDKLFNSVIYLIIMQVLNNLNNVLKEQNRNKEIDKKKRENGEKNSKNQD